MSGVKREPPSGDELVNAMHIVPLFDDRPDLALRIAARDLTTFLAARNRVAWATDELIARQAKEVHALLMRTDPGQAVPDVANPRALVLAAERQLADEGRRVDEDDRLLRQIGFAMDAAPPTGAADAQADLADAEAACANMHRDIAIAGQAAAMPTKLAQRSAIARVRNAYDTLLGIARRHHVFTHASRPSPNELCARIAEHMTLLRQREPTFLTSLPPAVFARMLQWMGPSPLWRSVSAASRAVNLAANDALGATEPGFREAGRTAMVLFALMSPKKAAEQGPALLRVIDRLVFAAPGGRRAHVAVMEDGIVIDQTYRRLSKGLGMLTAMIHEQGKFGIVLSKTLPDNAALMTGDAGSLSSYAPMPRFEDEHRLLLMILATSAARAFDAAVEQADVDDGDPLPEYAQRVERVMRAFRGKTSAVRYRIKSLDEEPHPMVFLTGALAESARAESAVQLTCVTKWFDVWFHPESGTDEYADAGQQSRQQLEALWTADEMGNDRMRRALRAALAFAVDIVEAQNTASLADNERCNHPHLAP